MYGSTEASHGLPEWTSKINGKRIDTALAVERLAKSLRPIALDKAGRHLPRVEVRGRAEEGSTDRRVYEQLAVIAHELRNSLGAIRNAAWLMQMNRRELAIAEDAQLLLGRQVVQMSRLIEDLLEVSQIRSGRLSLKPVRTDLRIVARCAVESVEPEIRRRNQRLQVDMPETPVWLQADPGRLAQVLVNLLGNAAKYTDKCGELRLSVEREAGGVAIRVSDTGIGIAADVLPHVFEPFVQANSSLDRCERGIGIGLALVSSLVEMHGGRVCAASAGLGLGSEFTVHLPVQAA